MTWSRRITSERRITGVRLAAAQDYEEAVCATEDHKLMDQPQTLATDNASDDFIASGTDVCLNGKLEDVWNAGYQAGLEEGRMAHEPEEPIHDVVEAEDREILHQPGFLLEMFLLSA